MVTSDASRRQLVVAIRVEIARTTARTTARRYQIALDALDASSLWELLRLLRDREAEKRTAVRRAQHIPWRR